ncbi:MAG: discoidin domain-containing protein, partial [Verrucomicrobia bacterium]|nr:discoidin domain-containing protein [Verrucomicrobiota bacterium]
PFAGSRLPEASAVWPDPIDRDEILRHAALGARYAMSPMPEGAYGDTPARLLTDGVVPAKGWGKGRTVGWMGSKVRASAILDLGREFAIERVDVHVVGGGSGSVNFPSRTVAMLGRTRPPPVGAADVGALPVDFATGACGELLIDRRRSANDADAHVPVTFAPGSRGRYVTVSQQGPGSWIMLSEIRVLSGGTNVAASAPYTLFPPPTPATFEEAGNKDENLRYPDDGARLTDGMVAKGFSRGQTTGWRGTGDRNITVDLGDMRPVRCVRIWVLRGGRSGICAPAKVSVAGSSNGATWTAPVSARAPEGPVEDGSRCEAAAFEAVFPAGAAARHVRVDFAPGRGWTMVSEIEVQSD